MHGSVGLIQEIALSKILRYKRQDVEQYSR